MQVDITIIDALESIAKGKYSYADSNGNIAWEAHAEAIPTTEELAAEVLRLQAEYDANQYQRDRAAAYPSLTEQADMAYWDRQNGTTTLDDAINAVKAAHPKPTGEA
jgi:hypothetical protein